ncbi:MAG: DEAD/DEAH box helicase family protein [Gammaproteobacteria bacterium]
MKNRAAFWQWSKLNKMPLRIPTAPDLVYKNKGWKGWGDWLGTGYIAHQNRKYKSFDDATKYIQSLGIKSQTAWSKWSATEARPKDIPGNPQHTYSDEWKGWGDWLGTGYIAHQNRKWLAFEDARAFARSLKFVGKNDWTEWAKLDIRPIDIPAYPNEVYAKKGWSGWQDWLGLFNNWNINNVKAFIRSLLPHLNTLSPAGLHTLFQQTGLKVSNHNKSDSFLLAFKSGKFPKEELKKFVNDEDSLVDKYLSKGKKVSNENDCFDTESFYPTVESKEILASLDNRIFSNLDKEAIDFFIKEAVAKIWQQAFSEPEVTFNQVQQYDAHGAYSDEVKRIFLEEYQQTKNLEIPSGYGFNHHPNLMQRYTAYMVKCSKRVGNWSGTGAGKTLSAILASRVIDSHVTVICCPNNVVSNWEENIKEIYPNSICVSKTTNLKKNARKHQYLILHYEFFQHSSAQRNLLNLLEEHIVDFVIVDEIHFSKQRVNCKVSKRKKVVAAFLSEANARNENLHVLGMSATPVINTLFEGKTLIELVTGVHHDDIQTLPSVDNCISLYKKFVSHGIRWLPKYEHQLNIHDIPVDCTELLSKIKQQSIIGSFVDLEIILTRAKIPFILSCLQPKTIVYTHYIKNILLPLQNAIQEKGWRVAIFTGENKLGLDAFIKGDSDILIASSCVGTGVDKLQFVCNRLIVNSLPWTHAEFEQLKGRIYRQGQVHNHVDIFVPLTFAIINGDRWSWCESRWKRIQFKKSIADAAVDGVIPEGHLRTPAQAYKDTMLWLERLECGGVHEIERRKLSVPLLDEL